MRSALVIGASGMLGRHLCQRLRAVTAVTEGSRATGIDLTRPEPFAVLRDAFDVIFNCAVAHEGRTLEELVAVNALGAQRAAHYALQSGAYLVHASTVSALAMPGDAYLGPYGLTKRLGDELVAYTASNERRPAAVVRFSQLYDADGAARRTQPMLFRLIEQLREQGGATLYGSRDPLRNYLHVDDAVTIMQRLAELRLNGTWPATHPESVSVTQLAACIARQLGKPAEIRWLADKPSLPDVAIPLTEAIAFYHRLGWSPSTSLDEGLGRLIRGN